MPTACLKCMMCSNSGSWSRGYESTWSPQSSSLGYNQRRRNSGMMLPRLRLEGCEHFSPRTLTTSFVSCEAVWSTCPCSDFGCTVFFLIVLSLGLVYIWRGENHHPLPPLTYKWQLQLRGSVLLRWCWM